MPPAITTIIPAFNAASTIGEALDSATEQRFRDFEVIVVDDASTDGTADRVRHWGGGVKDVVLEDEEKTVEILGRSTILIRLNENAGPARARNKGIEQAQGEWIGFLDADDAWLPWRLSAQMNLLREYPQAGLVCGGTIALDEAADVLGAEGTGFGVDVDHGMASRRIIPLDELAAHNPIATSTVLARKSLIEGVGLFDERFKGPEDYDLWLRLAAQYPAIKLEIPLVRYRTTGSGLSKDDRTFLPQVLRVLDKAYGPGGVLCGRKGKRKAQAHQLLSGSWVAAKRGAVVRALGLFIKSLWLWPGSFGPYLHLPWGRIKLLFFFGKTLLRNNEPKA